MVGKKVLAKVAGVLVLGGVILWMEPWADRFEGRTVDGWLQEFRGKREIDVVDGFGANAVPKLVSVIEVAQRRKSRRELWESLHDEVRRALSLANKSMNRDRPEEHELLVAAGTWLSWLEGKGYGVRERGLPPKASLWMDAWDDTFWAPRWVQLAVTTPEESKAARGAEERNDRGE